MLSCDMLCIRFTSMTCRLRFLRVTSQSVKEKSILRAIGYNDGQTKVVFALLLRSVHAWGLRKKEVLIPSLKHKFGTCWLQYTVSTKF